MFSRPATIVWSALVISALSPGCGTTDEKHLPVRTFVGQVTEVGRDRVCVGAHDASGECFRPNETTRGLHVGDCVQVTYETGVGKVRDQVRDVAAVDADSHPADCPG